MPLLARMLTAPLTVEVRRGAIAQLGMLLADSRVATSGRVAIAVGSGQGEHIVELISKTLDEAEVFHPVEQRVGERCFVHPGDMPDEQSQGVQSRCHG